MMTVTMKLRTQQQQQQTRQQEQQYNNHIKQERKKKKLLLIKNRTLRRFQCFQLVNFEYRESVCDLS